VLSSRGHGARKEDIRQKEDACPFVLEHQDKPERGREKKDHRGEENPQEADKEDGEEDVHQEDGQEDDKEDCEEDGCQKVSQEDGQEIDFQEGIREEDLQEDDAEDRREKDCEKAHEEGGHLTRLSFRPRTGLGKTRGRTKDGQASSAGGQVRQEAARADPPAARE
jgi:hypothetical protein